MRVIGFLALLLAAGCALPPYEMGVLVEKPKLADELAEAARGRLPPRFTVVQRRLVTRGEQELVFTEYLSVDRVKGALKTAAVNDVGAKLYVAAYDDGEGVTIEHKGPGLPKRAVEAFVMDSAWLYLDDPAPWAILVRHADSAWGLYAVHGHTAAEFRFDPTTRHIVGYNRSRGDGLLYSASWEYGKNTVLPSQVQIEHFRGGYRASLRPVQLEEK